MDTVSKYLNLAYLKWQQGEGGRKTVQQFADYLGVNRPTLSLWMNGDTIPDEKSLEKLADRLGVDIFEAAGKPKPDPRLLYIQKNWKRFSEEGKKRISEEASKYAPDEAHENK